MNHQEILENSLSHKCDYCNVKFCQLLSLTAHKRVIHAIKKEHQDDESLHNQSNANQSQELEVWNSVGNKKEIKVKYRNKFQKELIKKLIKNARLRLKNNCVVIFNMKTPIIRIIIGLLGCNLVGLFIVLLIIITSFIYKN